MPYAFITVGIEQNKVNWYVQDFKPTAGLVSEKNILVVNNSTA